MAAVAARLVFWSLKRLGAFRRRLLIVGAGTRAWDLLNMLRNEGRHPNYEITFLHDPAFGPIDPRVVRDYPDRVISDGGLDVLAMAHLCDPDTIVVAPDERRGMPLDKLLACKTEGYPVLQYLSFWSRRSGASTSSGSKSAGCSIPTASILALLDNALKRLLDVAVSILLLLLFSPFLLIAAIAIKIGDRGPVIYSQERVSRNETRFQIYKMRTMRVDAEAAGAVWAQNRDPRITRVGNFLRQTRIDEMPQLLNVLRGDMSLVARVRSALPFVDQLAEHLPLYHERHMVKAGLTAGHRSTIRMARRSTMRVRN